MARPRKFDEAQVLQLVRDRFWSCGYAATSVDDILKDTGLGKGSLYGAFGDKRKLFLRTFDEYCAELVDDVRSRLDGPDEGALARLSALVLAIAEATVGDTSLRGCLLARGTAELSGLDPEIRAIAQRTFAVLEGLVADSIAAAQRSGGISADADPGGLGALVLAVLRGIEALGKGGSSPETLRSAAETALALLPRP
ncbi:TetR/AcrR family transcriptional regulator [Streptomyces ferrugineus]|uniref:TetR/AcrR family transcriptional regulator n=1 Tax=Streptomyces ferrugineus TaxID=1413221 RepID=A0A7M2SAM6_9ACTN|nr:TetR/AcrR family transcriptional regulator [Streptomyces ferrugineus]QOV33322.1 TetR/AcrR family transcriptional regulator [Streptomyces ferrugineus]